MSKEYIEREVAIQELNKVLAPTPSESYIVGKCIDTLDKMSVEDVVKVIRCSECAYKQEHPDTEDTCYLTCNLSWGLQGIIDPNDFCSYGKNKFYEVEE